MSKPSTRTTAPASRAASQQKVKAPIAQHDAALLDLVEKCLEAERRRDAALDQFEAAELRGRRVPAPQDVIKTQYDVQSRLAVGLNIGRPYETEEIAVIRGWVRSTEKGASQNMADFLVYERACAILAAWADWKDDEKREAERSGMTKARGLDGETLDEHDALLAQLVRTRASTIDGVLAKARASRYLFDPPETVAEKIREGIRDFGVDCDVLILSMARDLIELAAAKAA
jgi:hypothetical protein